MQNKNEQILEKNNAKQGKGKGMMQNKNEQEYT